MAKIKATEERTLSVAAAMADVYQFFASPARIRELTPDVEQFEMADEHTAHWVFVEKVEKGVRYGPEYTAVYTGNGTDKVEWCSQGEGNMEVDGVVTLRELGPGQTEFHYRETVIPDLPISKLTAIIFKPIVARELRQDIGKFLDRVVEHFGGKAPTE